jgi:18S rRNA (adenine1779-N6/adenine1780-N6)-dimethyltransferase
MSFLRVSQFLRVKLKPLKVHPNTGVHMSSRLGQYFTSNDKVIDSMVEAAEIKSSDTVLEIGCGSGNITMRLLPLARKVISIEIDPRFAEETRERAKAAGFENLEIIEGDAVKVAYPPFDICVANPPYNISTPLIFRLTAHRPAWRRTVIMLQKEVANRLMADPGNTEYSRLSVNTSIFLRAEKIEKVSGGAFYPQSAVQSVIMRLIPRYPLPLFDAIEWDGLIKICFRERRRSLNAVFNKQYVQSMLEVNYKTWCALTRTPPVLMSFPDYLLSTLEELNLEKVPVLKLSAETLQRLLHAFHRKGIFFANVGTGRAEPPAPSFAPGVADYVFYDK